VTDRPILFSAPMVRALLDGRKTQTRRVLKPQLLFDAADVCIGQALAPKFDPGDRLWVREKLSYNWQAAAWDYAADGSWVKACRLPDPSPERYRQGVLASMFMPRWASRLTLLVTDVRVQRLQDISERDALAEGVALAGLAGVEPVGAFALLWMSINGPDAWAENPWVAAISFDVVRANIDQVPA
jgi:hypothetical protein